MSTKICILSGSTIVDGDPVVAVLTVPRRRHSAMAQQFAPTSAFHLCSAASFPIRGRYDSFGHFAPFPDQFSVDLLMETLETRTWATTLEKLHEEGYPHRFSSFETRKKVVEICHSAFAFVHEPIYDAVAPSVSVAPAIDQVLALKKATQDPAQRSTAFGKLLMLGDGFFLFGPDQHRSSAASDGIGEELLSEALGDALRDIIDLPGDELGRAQYLLSGMADLSSFEAALDVAGAVLQPSISGSCVASVRNTIAAMSIEIAAMRSMENDVENDEPTPAVQDMADLAARLKQARDEADRRQQQFMNQMGY